MTLGPIRNTALTIGTTLVVVEAEMVEGQRSVILLTNVSTGAQIISIFVNGEAVAGQGIVLYPGGAWTESIDSLFRPTNKQITAIASAAGAKLAIHTRLVGL